MLTSSQHVHPHWRNSFETFCEDIDPFTPNSAAGRIIATRNPRLGFIPGNVEWHWENRRNLNAKKD
ncbi:hypothetical protein CYG48_21295 (plasmid) [Neorhizobium sp. SOG26]|nr:hypothetical protein CYG48_21295 [Neorhizobium sp. SOG26]